jgi:hypothetical protein
VRSPNQGRDVALDGFEPGLELRHGACRLAPDLSAGLDE